MIFARQSAHIVQRARVVVHRFIRGALVASLSCGGMAPAAATSYDGAMAKAEYTLVAGDVNGDGRVDFLVKSKPKLLMVPLGDDLSVPITLPAPSPTFMLRSSAGGTYSLVSNPSAQDLAFAWGATDYKLAPALPEAGGNDALSIFTTTAGNPTFLVAMSPATGALQLTRTVWLPPAGSPVNAMLPSDYAVFSADINGDKQNDVLFKARSRIVLVPDPASDDEDDMIISIIKPRSTTFALVSSGYGKYTLVVHPLAEILDSPLWKPATQTIAFSGVNGIFSGAVTITPVDREQASFVVSMKGDTGELLITSSAPPAVDMNTPPPLITVKRTPYPLEAGKLFDLTWSTTDATSMTRTCTADGTGFRNASMAVGASGAELAVRAKSEWISYPSTCTWTATGPGGTATFVETVNTKYVLLDGQPTIAVSHLPARFVAEAEYALTAVIGHGGGGARQNCTIEGQRVFVGHYIVDTFAAGRHVSLVPAAWAGKTLQCTFSATNLDGLVAETSLTIPVDPIPPGGNIGQLTGNVAGVSIDGNGAASVHGYACFPKSTEALEVQVSVYDEAIDFKVALIDGMTNIASSDAIASSCNTVGTGAKHGWSIPLGQFQQQYAGKVIHVRGLSKIGDPVMLPNSGRYSIPTGNLSGYLTASHTQIISGSNGTADVTLEGAGTNGGGTVQHVALVWDKGDGSAPVVVETFTPSGAPSSVPIKKTMALGVGQHKFTLRITDSNWTTKELSPWVSVSVLGSTVFGATNPVHQEGGTNYLSAWACENNRGDALSYKVFTDAPSLALGGKQIASGAGTFGAFVPTAANQEKCHTPGSGYSFKIDLDATRNPEDGPIAGNTPLYVEVQTMSGAAVTLPSATGSAITMPTGVQIALATPANGDKVEAPGPVFISARVTGGVKPGEVVEFAIDNVWMPAKQDSDGSNLYYLVSPDNLVDLRFYAVRARVKNSSRVLAYSAISSFEVTAKAFVRVAVPPVDAKFAVGAAVTLSATTAGLAAPVATLQFYLDGRELVTGTSSNGKWTATWTPTAAGAYSITASAFDSESKLLGTAPAVVYNIAAGAGSPASPDLLAVNIAPPHLNNDEAGTLPGELNVSKDGAATYSVALVVPPGTAGLAPALSLSYTSTAPNGQIGLGWSLGGMTSIHRCGKTIAQDGINDRIRFEKSDRLCLDGQRLVLVNLAPSDDNYWADSAQYRTEIDSFARITAQGIGLLDRSFKLEAKDGRILTFGTAGTSSQVRAVIRPDEVNSGTFAPKPVAKSGPLSWAVNEVKDRAGNFIRYGYEQSLSTGEHRPSVIRYGAAGNAAHAAVQLTYDARPDSWKRYLDEARNDMRSRLTHIKTWTGSNLDGDPRTGFLVRTYSLGYDQSLTSGRSLLHSIQVSARDAQGIVTTLPPTRFDWGKKDPNKVAGFKAPRNWIGAPVLTTFRGTNSANHSDYFAFADFNVDGRTDVLERRVASPEFADMYTQTGISLDANPIPPGTLRTAYRYFHNNGNGFSLYSYSLNTGENFAVLETGDFDGNGTPDVLVATELNGAKICLSPLGNGAGPGAGQIVFTCDPNRKAAGKNSRAQIPFVFDVRGDGRAAHYTPVSRFNTAQLCIADNCVTDNDPPVDVIGYGPRMNWQEKLPSQQFVAFTQMIDFSGTGKPVHVSWSDPHYEKYRYDPDGTRMENPTWENLTPIVSVTGLREPGAGGHDGGIAGYFYPPYPAPVDGGTWPYFFARPHESASIGADFNGSGYSGLAFGFHENKRIESTGIYTRADLTLCISTGRALDCGVRKKFSDANYHAVRAVGNFVGDGQPSIMLETLRYQASNWPTPTGNVQMCRVMGDDTAGGADTDDKNIVCEPWAGITLPSNPINVGDTLFFMDLLGIGRTQAVIYRSGKVDGGTWLENGTWEMYEPNDLAVQGQALDRIHKVTNGLGSVSAVEYVDGLASGTVRRSETAAPSYPLQATPSFGKIVKTLRIGNGVAGMRTTNFEYHDAVSDATGRGALGFAKVVATDADKGIVTTTTYAQRWPHTGMVSLSATVHGQTELTRTTNRLTSKNIIQANGATTIFPTVAETSTERHDLRGHSLGSSRTSGPNGADVEYDEWGNLLRSTTVTTGSARDPGVNFTTAIVNAFEAGDLGCWLVAKLSRSNETKSHSHDAKVIARAKAFTYEPGCGGYVRTETLMPDDASLAMKQVISYQRNGLGLITETKQTWRDLYAIVDQSRTNTTTYDPLGRYPAVKSNALGHTETLVHDANTGSKLSVTSANLLETKWQVNGFGRITNEMRPDGNETRHYVKQCDLACPADSAVATITETLHGTNRIAVPVVRYSDSADHALRSLTWGFDGQPIVVDSRYDELGRLHEVDHPRFLSSAAVMERRQLHDDLDRAISVSVPNEQGDLQTSTTDYQGFTVVHINAKNQQRVDRKDVLDRVEQTEDAYGKPTTFRYDPFGGLIKITDPNGNVIAITYDDLGRKTELNDPDLGQISYFVDALGRTWKHINPIQRTKGWSTRFEFDVLDRMTGRYAPDLEGHWVFDTAVKGKGQLAEAYIGTASSKTYRRVHTFDTLGRPSTTTQELYDANYTSMPEYDLWGRPLRQTYRRGGDMAKVFDLRYNEFGYMKRLERGDLVLWESSEQDAALRVRKAMLGNGLVQEHHYNIFTGRLQDTALKSETTPQLSESYHYDPIGNVTLRSQYWAGPGFSETFGYDDLNRLRSSRIGGVEQSFEYDAVGNLLRKTGVGTGNYVYPTQGEGVALPHAVRHIPSIGDFKYDTNGNLLSGAGRSAEWTTFDMPSAISKGGNRSEFVYGPEQQRVRQIMMINGSVTRRLVYAGPQEVELTGNNQVVSVKTYWPNGLGVEIDRPNLVTELNWVHKDRLGSPVAITGSAGSMKEMLAYDAWGKRRTLDGEPINGTSTPDLLDGTVDNRGFTGHEMLDSLDLVHMNGRVYDPLVARFMSADPLIQDPMNGQNYSRYTYVFNNPTNITDPTGFAGEDERDREARLSAKMLTIKKLCNGTAMGLSCAKNWARVVDQAIEVGMITFEGEKPTLTVAGDRASSNKNPGSANKAASESKETGGGGLVQWLSAVKNANLALQTAEGGLKVGLGALSVKAGVAFSATGIGAIVGVPLAAVGASEATEGASMLVNTYEGKLGPGYNPGKEFANLVAGEKWGNTLYHSTALASNLGGLAVKMPLVLGTADGMNRAHAIFGGKITGWENGMYVPGIGYYAPQMMTQSKSALSNAYGGYKVGANVAEAEEKK